jgi:hypothetical protein
MFYVFGTSLWQGKLGTAEGRVPAEKQHSTEGREDTEVLQAEFEHAIPVFEQSKATFVLVL